MKMEINEIISNVILNLYKFLDIFFILMSYSHTNTSKYGCDECLQVGKIITLIFKHFKHFITYNISVNL